MKDINLYNRSTLYRTALKTFGPEAQLLKLTEEAAELAAAAARNMNGAGSEMDLAGELADVEIMTEQCRLNGMGKLIDFQKQKKLARLAERLGVTYIPETEKAPAVFYPPQLTALAQKLPSRELLEDWCGAVPNSAFIGATDEEIADMARFILCVMPLPDIHGGCDDSAK